MTGFITRNLDALLVNTYWKASMHVRAVGYIMQSLVQQIFCKLLDDNFVDNAYNITDTWTGVNIGKGVVHSDRHIF